MAIYTSNEVTATMIAQAYSIALTQSSAASGSNQVSNLAWTAPATETAQRLYRYGITPASARTLVSNIAPGVRSFQDTGANLPGGAGTWGAGVKWGWQVEADAP